MKYVAPAEAVRSLVPVSQTPQGGAQMQPAGGLPAVRATELRMLAAFVHSDMVDFSRLIGQDEVGTCSQLAWLHRAVFRPALERHGGKINNTAAGSLLMEFSSVVSAVRFALEIQTRIPEFDNGPRPDDRIRFRMGINIGNAIHHNSDIHSVNVAANLQTICPPGCVCVSAAVRNHVQGLALQFEPLGAVLFKNVTQPVDAFVVRLDHFVKRKHRGVAKALAACAVILLLVGGGGVWLVMHSLPDAVPTTNPR